MKIKDPAFFLQDIKSSLDKILKYTEGISFEEFINDDKTKDADERNFEIIGEAVNIYPIISGKNIHISHLNKLPECGIN